MRAKVEAECAVKVTLREETQGHTHTHIHTHRQVCKLNAEN